MSKNEESVRYDTSIYYNIELYKFLLNNTHNNHISVVQMAEEYYNSKDYGKVLT